MTKAISYAPEVDGRGRALAADAPAAGSMACVDKAAVDRWVARYERAWRTPGIEPLAELFTPDVTYVPSPWAQPIVGLSLLGSWWDAERTGPDEPFTMTSEVVAVDGQTAVVRIEVDYQRDDPSRWRDLWILRFDADGRCARFEEWPFAPDQPDGH
jgi:ketosteroid isomerase-like protein